jgi:chemotaxis signal transduction protein
MQRTYTDAGGPVGDLFGYAAARAIPSNVPSGSAINAHLPGAYFYDCYSLDVPDSTRSALGYFLTAVADTPPWINALMALRNKIVQLVGLKDLGGLSGINPSKPESAYRPGDRIGIFTLISNTDAEVLLGDNDKHLNVILSIFKKSSDANGVVSISATTVVHVHNLLGRIYMIPVTPLHKIISPAVISRLARVPGAV